MSLFSCGCVRGSEVRAIAWTCMAELRLHDKGDQTSASGCHITACGGQADIFTSVSLLGKTWKTSAYIETVGGSQVNC